MSIHAFHPGRVQARVLLLAFLLASCDRGVQGQEHAAQEPPPPTESADPAHLEGPAPTDPAPNTDVEPATGPEEAVPATGATPESAPAGTTTPVANEPDQAQGANQAEDLLVPQHAPGGESTAAQRAARRRIGEVGGIVPPAAERPAAPAQPVGAAASPALRRERFAAVRIRLRPPALLAGTEPGASQPQTVMSLRAGNVGITNLDAALAVNFAMKSELDEWRSQQLSPRASEEFTCSSGNNDCLFWMRTGDKPAVFYKIHSPDRYAIFWNGDLGLWDLRRVERED